MPRLRDTLVNGEPFGEIRLTLVRLPQDTELPGTIAHLGVRPPTPPAPRRASSEILEPFRNLGWAQPAQPWSVRHRIPSNPAFSPGGDHRGRGKPDVDPPLHLLE
jgi:hypothetical protein